MRDEHGRRLWDVSQRLRPGLPVWPGDTRFEIERTWVLGEGSPVNVGRLSLSTQSGTHTDAPLHYRQHGTAAGDVALLPYLGSAQMIDVRRSGPVVRREDVEPVLSPGVTRVLLRTFEAFPLTEWPPAFSAIDPDLISALAERGVILIGTDAPSLDPQTSKTLDAHHAASRARVAILEGLVLDDVPAGDFELIALPLAIEAADASPVRAVLRELS